MIKENNLEDTDEKVDESKKTTFEKDVKMVEIAMSKKTSETTTKAIGLFKNVTTLSERMVVFSTFCLNNKKIINKIFKDNKLNDSNLKLNDVIRYMPNLLDFANKKAYFYSKIEKMRVRGGRIRLEISRDNILQNAFHELYHKSAREIRGRLHISYTGEAGVDAGGLTRDFYTELSKEMFA